MSEIVINNRKIGTGNQPFIIAEAGINHNGDIEIAKNMVLAAKASGVDAVKFQTFYAKDFIKDKTLMYTYQSQGKEITEPVIDMFERSEFSKDEWKEIKEFCDKEGILFLSTPGNVSDLELLMNIGVKAIKIGSDDFVNIPLIRRFSQENVPLLLSCGMANEEEIDLSLKTAGIDSGKELCLFLCTSQYPTPPKNVNIRKLKTLRKKYPDLVVGLSDHTKGSTAAIMAIACGASIFEKHFTLDHDLPGPDHWFSETPESLAQWVRDIKEAYDMLGFEELRPTEFELKMRSQAHRSITARCIIKKGSIITEEMLCMRRPGDGLTGSSWDLVVGKKANRDINEGEQLSINDFVE